MNVRREAYRWIESTNKKKNKKKRGEIDKRERCTEMKFCKLSCVQLSHFTLVLRSEFISNKSHQISNASFRPSWQ